MESEQFKTILDRLDKIMRLLALQVVKEKEKEQDKIELLDSLDFRPVDIAKMLGKSPANVSMVLGTIRKRSGTPGTPVKETPATPAGVIQEKAT